MIIPFSVHAGFFAALFDTATAETKSDAYYPHDSNMQTIPLLKAAVHTDPNPAKDGSDVLVIDGALVSTGESDGKHTKVNTMTNNGEISVYTVREGDTLSQIAEMFNVSAKTILWANDIKNPSQIIPGHTLVILPITGVRHIMKSGDTIQTIAKKYNGDVDDIVAYNQLASAEDISVGETIVIPNGVISAPPTPTKSKTTVRGRGSVVSTGGGSSGFINPLPGSIQTQGIHGYNGVDLSGVPVGTHVLAAASGEVIVAKNGGWNGGYGSYVVIKHPNGTQTLYGHLSSVAVTVGQKISGGSVVGGMGNTGRSTGPHLHFEVRGARNPF